ncbi:MAG: TetR/AcrR family transcriptional regulator [Myxococcales bacterium]|nr:MAG: TetR/AcrR family transcriptional regulator [Myxococcales bacterium]
MGRPSKRDEQLPKREKLLLAAFKLIRSQGYSATSVDELCKEAGVTKGTFFHYFKSKDALAVAAANHWSLVTGNFFDSAAYHDRKDPLQRFIGYIDFRKEILQGTVAEFTCLVGTMVQETYDAQPDIRKACRESIFAHAQKLEADIREAKSLYANKGKWSAESLALHTQAVIQGAFILAKASGSADIAAQSLDHLKNYVQLLFSGGEASKRREKQ